LELVYVNADLSTHGSQIGSKLNHSVGKRYQVDSQTKDWAIKYSRFFKQVELGLVP
jgi:hypothetical protein